MGNYKKSAETIFIFIVSADHFYDRYYYFIYIYIMLQAVLQPELLLLRLLCKHLRQSHLRIPE